MSNIKCIILDDEPIAREIMEKFANRIGYLQLIAVAEDPVEAIKILQDNSVDLLISDIQMPGFNGLQLIQSLPSPPLVIFITAHDNFAVSSFELDVVDYLLKPVSFERFLKAINKARSRIMQQKPENHYKEPSIEDGITIKKNENLIRIQFADILYFKADRDFVQLFSSSGEKYTIRSTISEIQQKIPAGLFVRIHNSYIVAISAIKSLTKDSVRLSDSIELPLSRSHKKELFKKLNLYNT
jgi:DNA-binding LytR/AlgR family response regulator